jgi:hypothetical protein
MIFRIGKIQFIGWILLLLTACNMPRPTPPTPILESTPTFTPSPTLQGVTSTPAPTATGETPTPQATSITATPTACKDEAAIASWLRDDVPYDFTDYNKNKPTPPNENFTMSWTLQNTGTCIWDSSYVMMFESGYQMTQTTTFPIVAEGGKVLPGQSTIVNISMVAPQKTGGHQALWRLQSREGVLLKFTIVVKVDTGTYHPPLSPLELVNKVTCAANVGRIRLSWVDASDNEDGYRIYRNSELIQELPANAATFLDAVPGVGKYTYAVVAFNVAGEGSATTFVEITTCP